MHLLLCEDLLKSKPLSECINILFHKLRQINIALIFRHEELKKYYEEEKLKQLFKAVAEFAKAEDILNQEHRF